MIRTLPILALLAFTACAPHTNPPHSSGEAGSPKAKAPKAAPERWFPETPGAYTRTLPDGRTQTVIVEAPLPIKGGQ